MDFKNEKGFTLVLSLIFLTVLIILGASISSIFINEYKASHKHYKDRQSYYYARTGAEYAIANSNLYKKRNKYAFKIKDFSKENIKFNELEEINNINDLPEKNDIEVFIEKKSDHFKITSIGKYKTQKTQLSVKIKLNTVSLPNFNYALFASNESDNSIVLRGSSTLDGDVRTNSTSFNVVDFNGTAGITGNFKINKEKPQVSKWAEDKTPYKKGEKVSYKDTIYKAKWWTNNKPGKGNSWQKQIPNLGGQIEYLNNSLNYPTPEISKFPTSSSKKKIKLSGNKNGQIGKEDSYSFDTISLKSGTKLTINRNDKDKTIKVDHFDIKNGDIKFQNPDGDGKLKIYVKESLTFGADSSINKPSLGEEAIPDNVEIYYDGKKSPKFGGNITINANLFINNKAKLNIGGSNSTYGYIFSNGNNITIRGDANVSTIYAPNSNVEMKGSGTLKGAIVAKKFLGKGNILVDYVPPNSEKIPEEFIESLEESQGETETNLKIIKWSRD